MIIPVCLSTHFGVINEQIAGVPRVRRTLIFSENSSDTCVEKRFFLCWMLTVHGEPHDGAF